jgi:uncharacterized protein (TIGR03437 family)
VVAGRFLGLVLVVAPALMAQPFGFNFSQVDAILDQIVTPFNQGVALTITVEGETVYHRATGSFDTSRAIRIASASKWLAAATILTLVDERRLSLDDRVEQYLPQFTGEKRSITIRQLLSHTSGLVGDTPCLVSRSMTMAECVNEIAEEPLQFLPGTRFAYGNAAMQVAGHIAERVTGKSWNALFWERLGVPLEFRCTRLDGIGSLENPAVANGVVSCADDYTHFLLMIVNRGVYKSRRILSAAAIEEMARDQTGGVPIQDTLYAPFANLDPQLPLMRYGLGVWREVVDAALRPLELSSQGAFGFSPWVDLQRNLTGVLAVESSQDAIMQPYLLLKQAIRQAVPAWTNRSMLSTNGASFAVEPLAPGTVFTLFGPAIGPAPERTLVLESGNRIATQVDGLRVLVGGIAAPLIYSGWGQISAVIPFELAGQQSATIRVEHNGVAGPNTLIALAPASPGLFTLASSGRGQAAAINQDGSVNGASRPAARGSFLIFYATGLGAMSPPVPTGSIPTTAALAQAPVQVTIGGQPAEVTYAGAAPGLVAGVYQINVRVPASAPAGSEVPVVVQVGAAASPAVVTVAIR